MSLFLISVLHQYGYHALWLIVFVAAVSAPISGNLPHRAGGAFAAFGDFNLVLLFFVGLSAAVLGDNLGYAIGWKVGTPLSGWLEQQKRLRFISPQSVARGRAYFRRRAGLAIFLSRFFILVLGSPINLLAGADRYSYRKFLFWDISRQILGAGLPLGIGYIFAASWGEASNIFGAFSMFALASLVATFLSVVVLRRFRAKRKRVHLTWFSVKHVDAYLAPTREIFSQALQQGIAKERLHLTGRPIRRQF